MAVGCMDCGLPFGFWLAAQTTDTSIPLMSFIIMDHKGFSRRVNREIESGCSELAVSLWDRACMSLRLLGHLYSSWVNPKSHIPECEQTSLESIYRWSILLPVGLLRVSVSGTKTTTLLDNSQEIVGNTKLGPLLLLLLFATQGSLFGVTGELHLLSNGYSQNEDYCTSPTDHYTKLWE